jgi:hypothetical protein
MHPVHFLANRRPCFACCWTGGGAPDEEEKTTRAAHGPPRPTEDVPNALYSAPNNASVVAPSILHQATEAPSQLVPSLSSPNEDALTGTAGPNDGTSLPIHRGFRTPPATDFTVQSAVCFIQANAMPLIAYSPAQHDRDAIMMERIRRAYEEPRSHRGNPFMSNRNGNRISNLEGMIRMARMYYGEGGPFHHQQVALREAESDPFKRERMFRSCLLASFQRMVSAHFGPQQASLTDLRTCQSTSSLLPQQAATLHNINQEDPGQDHPEH